MPEGIAKTPEKTGKFAGKEAGMPEPPCLYQWHEKDYPQPVSPERRWLMDQQDTELQPFFSRR